MHIYKNIWGTDEKRCRPIISLEKAHDALQSMHKAICNRNGRRSFRAQQIYNVRPNVLPISIEIRDCVMIRTYAKQNYKLQSLWRGPIKVIDAKSGFVSIVKDTNTH